MFPSFSSSTQEILTSINNRRMLLVHEDATSPTESTTTTSVNGFDANVVMVLSVLLCAIVCSLAVNFIVRCIIGCSTLISTEPDQNENNNNINNNDNNVIINVNAAKLANTGVKKAALKTFPIVSYKADLTIPGLDTECVICLSEFVPGERVRLLPKCGHGFHVRCIDKWLSSHSSCPTCRHCLIETCNKIVGSHDIIISIASLSSEHMLRS